jgi:hypothetical protein
MTNPAVTTPSLAGLGVIEPNHWYLQEDVKQLLRLKATSLGREIRERRLWAVRRCGRCYILGQWILDWLA